MRGFPIRTSSDHGSLANSPRLIAGCNVLLRLLVPRHPPCALKNLTTKTISKMLASTVQFSINDRAHTIRRRQPPHPTQKDRRRSGTTSSCSPQTARPATHPQAGNQAPRPRAKQPNGCSLRTQQRARPTTSTGEQNRSLPTASCRRTRRPPASWPAVVDVPPSSTTP